MKSMTGFGRAEGVVAGGLLTVELRSVNHRYLDVRLRVPSWLSSLERPIGDRLRQKFSRGAFEGTVRFRQHADGESGPSGVQFSIDPAAAHSFREAVRWLESQHYIEPSERLTLSDLLAVGKIVQSVETPLDAAEHQAEVLSIVDAAILDLEKARAGEGQKLQKVLRATLARLTTEQAKILKTKDQQSAKIREKLIQRIGQWELKTPLDPQRLEWEVAFHADRADFTEETERLTAHFESFDKLLGSPEPAGRKLDFLLQEMGRETNTLSAKTVLLDVTHACIEMKTAIEQLREQVQNVE